MTAPTAHSESVNDSTINQRWATSLDGMNAYLRHQSTLDLSQFNGKLVLSVTEVADLLGLGRSAAYQACRTGDLPSRRIGRRVVVPVPHLLAWLNDNDA